MDKYSDILGGIVFAIISLFFIGFIMWGLSVEVEKSHKHNEQQIAKCEAMGGFAHTKSNGWLVSCVFPRGVEK